ncbi:MAG: THUMP-like domain-containing protein [Mycobacteriaceae bacterium]
MGYSFTVKDVNFLLSDTGQKALNFADAKDFSSSTKVSDVSILRTLFGDLAPALIDTVILRRKSLVKHPLRGSWLWTNEALQQSTPTLVAEHRAQRLSGRVVHDVTCSVGTELAALQHFAELCIGSDIDPVRVAMAAHNVPKALVLRADALSPCSSETVVIADPARRADGRRRHDPAGLIPPLPSLFEVYKDRDLAIKCAPGIDFAAIEQDYGFSGEAQVVSLDGDVRESCLWTGSLATKGVSRRATVISTGGQVVEVTDAESDDIEERDVGEWIIDPDGAIVRAGLVRHYAARHGLWQLDPRIAYLTGDAVPRGVRGFRILERLKYSEKTLKAELKRMDCGVVEILVRGIDVDPAILRPKLKLKGPQSYSVVITRISRGAVAFICSEYR